jgi:translation initiation factor 1
MGLLAGTQWDRPPHCERCGQPEPCACPPLPDPEPERVPPGKQSLRLGTERRKHGRVVTVIRGVLDQGNARAELLSQLKQQCGSGGSLADDTLELQGDHLDRAAEWLTRQGYRVARPR